MQQIEEMREQMRTLGYRIRAENDLVTLDMSPVYHEAITALHNSCIELQRALTNRHKVLLAQTYSGTTVYESLKLRIERRPTNPPLVPSVNPTLSHEEILRSIDETP